jgi:methionyl-tRNA formyltransferase
VRALETPPIPVAQDPKSATYAARIAKTEADIDWRDPAAEIDRQIRAFDPAPGAQTRHEGVVLKVWRATIEHGVNAAPGVVCAAGPAGIVVACGNEALRITELQRAGGKRMSAGAFLSGFGLSPGTRFGSRDG